MSKHSPFPRRIPDVDSCAVCPHAKFNRFSGNTECEIFDVTWVACKPEDWRKVCAWDRLLEWARR